MTQVKAGFIWSGAMSSGIIIKRLKNGKWGYPSSVGKFSDFDQIEVCMDM